MIEEYIGRNIKFLSIMTSILIIFIEIKSFVTNIIYVHQ